MLYYGCLLIAAVFVSVHSAYPERSDVLIILDTSKSISRNDLFLVLDFINNYLLHKSVSSGTTRIGLITFASKGHLQFSFEKYCNREGIFMFLDKLQDWPLGGKTNIDDALKKAIHTFKNYKGLSKRREIYLFSDGRWNEGDNSARSIKQLKHMHIKLFAFAVGKRLKISNLLKFVSSSKYSHFYRLNHRRKQRQKIITKLTGSQVPYVRCSGKGQVRDECNRVCTCVDGVLIDCYRLRREFTALSLAERKAYLQAYLKLTTKGPLKARFDKFVSIHKDFFWSGIHKKAQFFPWHRWYIYKYENMIREVDCRLTLPFWDWSYWSDIAWQKNSHIWREDEYGLGGDGDATKDFCVQTGLFKVGSWQTPANSSAFQVLTSTYSVMLWCDQTPDKNIMHGSCLRRSFNHVPANVTHVLRSVNIPCSHFSVFDSIVRTGYHNDMHNYIGGMMSSDYAGSTPEFFFHHGYLDNIWYRWQHKHPKCADTYYSNHVSDLIHSKYTTNDFLDSHNQGHCVDVQYEDFLTDRVDAKILASKDFHLKDPNDTDYVECPDSSKLAKDRPIGPFQQLKQDSRGSSDV